MICPDVDLFIQALEEGRVPQELEAHMEVCPVCRKMWWTLKNASPTARFVGQRKISRDVPERT